MNETQPSTPSVRFESFTDSWEQRAFGNILEEYRNSSTTEDEDILLSCAIEGMFLNSELFSHQRGASNIGYSKIKKGDLILSAQNLHLGNANVNLRFEHGIISPAYKVYNIIDCSPEFLSIWVKRDFAKQFFLDATTAGASQCRKNIEWDTLYQQNIALPGRREQDLIGTFFIKLDYYISQKRNRLEKLQTLRITMLERMFPQLGQKEPSVRIKGFTGIWKEYSFKNITYPCGTRNRDNLRYKSYSITNESGFVPQEEQFENGGTMKDADKRMYIIVEPNSFAYNPARINVGSIGYQYLDHNVIVSSLYEVFKTTDECNDQFLWYWFKTKSFSKMIEQLQEGGVRLYFYYDKLCMCSIRMPDIEEQIKIAEYFKKMDDLIYACSKELEKLHEFKKSLLEKMFV